MNCAITKTELTDDDFFPMQLHKLKKEETSNHEIVCFLATYPILMFIPICSCVTVSNDVDKHNHCIDINY